MNEITTVCNTLVYKRYSLPEKLNTELGALEILEKLIPGKIPSVVGKSAELAVFEFINGNDGTSSTDKNVLNQHLAETITTVYKNFKPFPKGIVGSWNYSLAKSIKQFKELNKVILAYDKSLFLKLTRDLQKLKKQTANVPLTYVHRDLHLGNLLQTGDSCVLLDFEHAMEGPIELEFQNSIFWNDEMSLDYKAIKKLLVKNGIPYSDELEKLMTSYYIVDQLILAKKENDFEKLGYIANKCSLPRHTNL